MNFPNSLATSDISMMFIILSLFKSASGFQFSSLGLVAKDSEIGCFKEYLGHKNLQSTQVYIHMERAMFRTMEPDEYHVKVAKTKEEIVALLEEGFEFVMEKDGLAYFRKRK